MIIARAPFRVTLAGGGTDLPVFYEKHGCDMVAAAVSRYVYILVSPRRIEENFWLAYSRTEIVNKVDDIQHELVREGLRLLDIRPGLEIHSITEIPSKTGLGTSGSFTVCLLNALHCFRRDSYSTQQLAEEACTVEIDILKKPVGKQDQFIAAFGGIQNIVIAKDGTTTVRPIRISSEGIRELENNCLFFYTNVRRPSSHVLGDQSKGAPATIESLLEIQHIGIETRKALEAEDWVRFGRLLDEHWKAKKGISPKVSLTWVDEAYKEALRAGALGGKLIGAGGGGFLMFFCNGNKGKIREALRKLKEVHFRFDSMGSRIIADIE